MKKNVFTLFPAILALMMLYSCDKQTQPVQEADNTPVLYAHDIALKTTLGNDWSVSWSENDDMSVFNVAAGATSGFSDNCRFIINGTPSDGKFIKDPSQTAKSLVSGQSAYDWYACSPWEEFGAAPGGTKGYTINRTPSQVGYNSSAHIVKDDIMAGVVFGVADGDVPSVALHHVGTLMKFTVVNNTGEAAAITGLTLDATAAGTYISGSFTLNWGDATTPPSLDATQMGSAKAYTCALKVVKEDLKTLTDETIANGASVDLYMVVAPFTIPSGGKVKITVSGSFGNLENEMTMASAITFAPGTYNTATVSYAKPASPAVFTETFGANSVNTANVPSYNKSGLTTADPAHAANYTYSVAGNASIQASTATTALSANYSTCGVTPAYVRLPATNNDSVFAISNVTVEANTDYAFKYNKVKGGGASETAFGWRVHGTDEWTLVNPTTAEGLITQEFNPGDATTIDVMVKSPKEGSHSPYTSVDNFTLIKK